MPRDPTKKYVNAGLTQKEYEAFLKEAQNREWAPKKLTEQILKWWLAQPDPKPLLKKLT